MRGVFVALKEPQPYSIDNLTSHIIISKEVSVGENELFRDMIIDKYFRMGQVWNRHIFRCFHCKNGAHFSSRRTRNFVFGLFMFGMF